MFKKFGSKLGFATLISGIVFISLSGMAYAHYYSNGYSYDVVDFNAGGNGALWIADKSADEWNNAANTRIGSAPESENTFSHLEYSDNWLGLYSPKISDHVYGYYIAINERTLTDLWQNNYPNEDYWTIAINTGVHEFGHALHLGHVDSSEGYDKSIMSYSRDRTDNTPRYHDVQDLKSYRGY